jgi:hypothetical protein
MKKLVYLFSAFLLSGALFLGSCSKSSDNTTPESQPPTISFVAGTGYITGDVTVNAGQQIKFVIDAFANSASGALLTKLTISRVYNNNPSTFDTVFANPINYLNHLMVTSTALPVAGQEKWFFTITDKNNQTAQISVTLTTIATQTWGEINKFDMKILGSYASPTGSSFASIDGTIYTIDQAFQNQSKIDWLYYYGDTDHATLAAPDDPHAAIVYSGASGLGHWTIKNATKFKLVTDPINWSSITNDSIILAETATGVTNSRIIDLSQAKILSFITASGKKGMIQVENITGAGSGTMTISVVVQK